MTSPKIEEYSFGHIRIDGRSYDHDVIIFPDRVQSDWWRAQGHSLVPQDLDTVLDSPPKRLIIGKGAHGRMDVPPETRRQLERAGIEILAQTTHEAVEAYNRLREEGDVVAALHLTC